MAACAFSMISLPKWAFRGNVVARARRTPAAMNQAPRSEQTLREGSKLRKPALNSIPVDSLWRNLMHIHIFLSPTNTVCGFFFNIKIHLNSFLQYLN